eukprot:9760987-Prorocentrum_lima.AAC.1
MSGVSSLTTPPRMSPTVTEQVRATDSKVILAAWNKAMVTCASFSKTVCGVTGNAPKLHADDNKCPNLGRSWQLHWMSAGRMIGAAAC